MDGIKVWRVSRSLPSALYASISQKAVSEVVDDVPPPASTLADLTDSDLCAAVDAEGCSDSIDTSSSDDESSSFPYEFQHSGIQHKLPVTRFTLFFAALVRLVDSH